MPVSPQRVGALLIVWIALVLCISGTASKADLTSSSVSPSSTTISVSSASSFTVTWTLVRTVSATPPNALVTSTQGVFLLPSGGVIGFVNTTLSRLSSITPPGTETIIFVETVLVPRDVAFRIAKLETGTASYGRSFTDGAGSPLSPTISLIAVGAGAANFGIRRIELRFEDDSRVKTPLKDDRFRALALVNFTGTGIAQFEWQIAEPPATSGILRFRPLRNFTRSLSGGGGITLESPYLPRAHSQKVYAVFGFECATNNKSRPRP